jgi:formylglycine-generating enzyme required for sulfatase activity
MKTTITQALQAIKDRFGPSIFNEPKRFKSVLADQMPDGAVTNAKLIRNLLNTAICDMKAYSKLESALPAKSHFVVDILAVEMHSDYLIDKSAAKVVIECIAELLDYVPNANLPTQPKPLVQPPVAIIRPSTPPPQNQPKTIRCDKTGIEMVFVQGGTFNMGGTSEQSDDCHDSEKPVRDVTVDGFYIGKYPVTQAQWVAVMGNNPSHFKNNPSHPVEEVSWDDVQSFISKLNSMTGGIYRLPTEAEWEFAARGGVHSRGFKYSGSNNLDEVAWYGSNSGSKTHSVGGKAGNELGIFDMSGNVWEWVADWYGVYNPSDVHNPKGPKSGSYRVRRGGGWPGGARGCRVSIRRNDYSGLRYDGVGFRLVLSP